jgi:hypothetical protein
MDRKCLWTLSWHLSMRKQIKRARMLSQGSLWLIYRYTTSSAVVTHTQHLPWFKSYIFLQNVPTGPGTRSASCSMGTAVKRKGRETDHSLPSSAEVKNEWSCTSILPIYLHGLDSDKEYLKYVHADWKSVVYTAVVRGRGARGALHAGRSRLRFPMGVIGNFSLT